MSFKTGRERRWGGGERGGFHIKKYRHFAICIIILVSGDHYGKPILLPVLVSPRVRCGLVTKPLVMVDVLGRVTLWITLQWGKKFILTYLVSFNIRVPKLNLILKVMEMARVAWYRCINYEGKLISIILNSVFSVWGVVVVVSLQGRNTSVRTAQVRIWFSFFFIKKSLSIKFQTFSMCFIYFFYFF